MDKDHVNLFQEIITELRNRNYSTPFFYSIYGLHKSDCELMKYNNIQNVRTCACAIFYNRYKLVKKLFKHYNHIFNYTSA